MGHLAIVNSDTINDIRDSHPYISITGELNSYPYKTISDLLADALAVRRGDKIFTWMIDGGRKPGIGFDRYYTANGQVVFDPTSDFPIKIGIEDGYKYENSVPEEEALDLFRRHLLWNAIGKKSLGRGRSLSHQTTDEDSLLINLLNDANTTADKVVRSKIISNPTYNSKYAPISINNFAVTSNNPNIIGASLSSVPVGVIVWNNDRHFLYEKTLEAYLCAYIDSPNVGFCSMLGYPNYSIKWLGNYLPYGVVGKNIDFVCEISDGQNCKIIVIELKNSNTSYNSYKDIVDNQLTLYTAFIKRAFISYRGINVDVEQVVITHIPGRLPSEYQTQYKFTKWIGYDIDPSSGVVYFKRIL